MFMPFSFKGRLKRLSYFIQQIAYSIIIGIFIVVVDGTEVSGLMLLLIPVFLIMLFSLHVRRLHDIGKSGYYSFLVLIPIFGLFYGLYLIFKPGQITANAYGNP